MLKPFQSFGRNRALDLRTVGKAESEKLPFLRSRDRALGLIHLECELLRDESRDAFHHSLTRARRRHRLPPDALEGVERAVPGRTLLRMMWFFRSPAGYSRKPTKP